ncbi:unnamed protein product [Amoebophrya sp. A120]|nr:unnamed protein product [Amoebophrya sp. A120]|eukprot:GSA120T00023101001.1
MKKVWGSSTQCQPLIKKLSPKRSQQSGPNSVYNQPRPRDFSVHGKEKPSSSSARSRKVSSFLNYFLMNPKGEIKSKSLELLLERQSFKTLHEMNCTLQKNAGASYS